MSYIAFVFIQSDYLKYKTILSISSKDITCINLILHIIQASIVAVGDDGIALCLECFKVVLNTASKEGAALFQGWLIDDYLCALCLDSLHDTLDGRLAEVIAI